MSRINTFVLIFFIFVSILLGGLWTAVQSEPFARFVSEQITRAVAKNKNTKISFSHLEVGVFPPSTSLKNTRLEYRDKNIGDVLIESSTLDIKFSLLNFMTSNLKLNELAIDDGFIRLKSNKIKKKKSDDKINVRNIYKDIRKVLVEDLPFEIQNFNFSKIDFVVDGQGATLEQATVNIYKSLFEVDASVYRTQQSPPLPYLEKMNIDEVNLKLQITENKTWAKEVSLKSASEVFIFNGQLEYSTDEIYIKGDSLIRGNISSISEGIGIQDELGDPKGFVQIESKISGSLKKPLVNFKVQSNDFHTKYAFSRDINIEGEVKNNIVTINKAKVFGENTKNYVVLREPVEVFSLDEKKILSNRLKVTTKNFHTNQALYALNSILEIFKGRLDGDVDIWWSNREITFEMQDGFALREFKLLADKDNDQSRILQNHEIKFKKGNVKILEDLNVSFDINIDQDYTKMHFSGLLTEEGLNFESQGGKLDIKELGPIAGVDINGRGPIDVRIYGGYQNVKFEFLPRVEDFEVIGIHLGRLNGKIELSLNDLILKVSDVKGIFSSTDYEAQGLIDFKNNDIDIDGKFNKTTYQDSIKIFKGLLSNLPFYPKEIRGNLETLFKVAGKLDKDKLKIIGKLKGHDFRYLDEDFENLSLDFSFIESNLDITNIFLNKGGGQFTGQFLYNDKSGYFEYDSRINGLQLDDINIIRLARLGMTGELMGEFYGNGTADDFSTRSHVRLTKTLVGNKRLNDSIFTVFNNSKDLFLSGNLLGEKGKFNMFFNLDENKKQNSYLNIFFKSQDPNTIFGILSQHNVIDKELAGEISGNLKSTFSVFDYKKLNIEFNLEKLKLKKGKIYLSLDNQKNKILITDGKVNKWDLSIRGGKDKIASRASGDVIKGIDLEQSLNLNSEILELLSPVIVRTFGRLSAVNRIKFSTESFDNSLQINAKDISIKIKDVPGVITGVKFKVLLDGKNLYVDNLNAEFGKGEISAKGLMRLAIPFPKADLSLNIKESNIPLFKKSGIVISSKARLHGNKFPYKLDGQVQLVGGTILDSIEDIAKKKSTVATYSKYIPLSSFEKKVDYVDLNLDVDFLQPLRVKNNFADLQFSGEGKVRGVLSNPVVNGKMDVTPGISKFLFKGHEFILKEGNIRVFGDESLNPSLNFVAMTSLDKYEIKLSVGGTAEQLSINLESEPYLSKEDILSLLTLGYTADISKNLEEKDRQSVTTIGLGTLIVDQLRLNEGLNSSLGLKLSVLPEFSENETSLLQGKSAVLDSSSSRLKSATKVKLQKKISKKVDLSVSSTVGGSLEQKQEMNLNYNINNNLSVEGVYEVRSTTEEESTQDPESVGADVKYKWTF